MYLQLQYYKIKLQIDYYKISLNINIDFIQKYITKKGAFRVALATIK